MAECEFCKIGIKNRQVAWRIIKKLSRNDMQLMLRWGWKIKGQKREFK